MQLLQQRSVYYKAEGIADYSAIATAGEGEYSYVVQVRSSRAVVARMFELLDMTDEEAI